MTWSAGAVLTAAQLNTYLPQAWTSYTPTIAAGGTIGNATRTGGYIQYGKTVHFWAKIVLGSTSAISGTLSVTLPVTATGAHEALAKLTDTGVTFYFARALVSSTNAQIWVTGTNGVAVGITATVPFTWVTTDEIFVSGTYEAA